MSNVQQVWMHVYAAAIGNRDSSIVALERANDAVKDFLATFSNKE